MLNQIKYRFEIFRLTWLNLDSIINRLDSAFWQPVAIELYNRGLIQTKPWLLVARSYIRKDIDN